MPKKTDRKLLFSIAPNGDVYIHDVLKVDAFKSAQNLVGGDVESIMPRLTLPNVTIWANEEGRMRGLPLNEMASRLVGIVLVGTIVLEPTTKSAESAILSVLDAMPKETEVRL